MKTLLTIFTLVFTLMFSSTSFADWTEVSSNMGEQNTYYVDLERIRKVDGFVYFWTLSDYSKPLEGTLSTKIHWRGDCKLLRNKVLSFSSHKEPMGGGTGQTFPVPESHKDWQHPPPKSSHEIILKTVCSR